MTGAAVREPQVVGNAAAGLVGAREDVGEGGAALLAGEPAEQYGRDLLAPRQLDREAGVDDHDGVRVGGGDGVHQLVLTAGQPEVLAIEALGLDAVGGGDHDDGGVGGAGGFYGLGDEFVGVAARVLVGEREADHLQRCALGDDDDVPQRHLVRLTGDEVHLGTLDGGAEERLEGVVLGAALDVVEVDGAVDGERERAETLDAEGVGAALARGEGAGQFDAVEGGVGDALGEVLAHPLDLAVGCRAGADDHLKPGRGRRPAG